MNPCKLYVGNLPYEVTSKELLDIFEQFGEILETMVIPHQYKEGQSKGYGFVTFANEASCQQALDMNGKEYKGRKLTVQIAKENTNGA